MRNIIVLLILIIGMATGYYFKCPVTAGWRLRANASCYSDEKYVCLFNLLDNKYQDDCVGPDASNIGSKLVFQPVFNLAECNARRFQPIVFTTNGNSECIFLKSRCDEEGQAIYSNGSSTNDIACRCDYTQRYSFVSKPKNGCFCLPSEEDCTCFRVRCSKLSSDYECITDGDIITKTNCPEIYPDLSFKNHNRIDQNYQLSKKRYAYADHATYVIVAYMAVFVVIAGVTVCIIEIKKRTFEQHQRKDNDRQQCIHELFQKGECGKLHFTRLVLIGKNGVGKTSLKRRLLWQKKEDVTTTQSTDGIEVDKCNIDITNGKWSPCSKIDDNIARIIHQVCRAKNQHIKRPGRENNEETVDVGGHFRLNTDTTRNVTDEKDTFYENSDNESLESLYKLATDTSTASLNTIMSVNQDNVETGETDLNQKQPMNIRFQKRSDNEINSNDPENDYGHVNEENIRHMTSTIMESCISRGKREHDDKLADCWIWDFAGQKDFYATHQVFLSKCAVFLLVTDSLDFCTVGRQGIDIEDSAQYVSFWFDAIHCYWSTTEKGRLDPPIIVVCTNEDKFKEHERQKRQEIFKENLGRVLINQQKKLHLRQIFFVSNTEDDDNVFEEIRKSIAHHAMDMPDWERVCPLKWLLFQQVLGKLKENGVPISNTSNLLTIAKHDDIGITNDEEFKLCLQYCHDNGTIIYFDEENLKDHVILDPIWLLGAFRCLVSDKIENIIKISDDWHKLKETGQLTDSLISNLFMKEPKLQYLDNKTHLVEVMKRFDIIVNLRNSSALYMPCMMKSCSFDEVHKQFIDEIDSLNKTSWLCLEFEFLPPAFFNHIIAWYIKQYSVSVTLNKRTYQERYALYRQIGVFDLDSSGCEKLVVCEGSNIIALQVLIFRMADHVYGNLGNNLFQFVKTLSARYRLHISYKSTFKCNDGNFTIDRKKVKDLLAKDYFCLEHMTNHLSDDLVKPWNFIEELERQRLSETFQKEIEQLQKLRTKVTIK